MKIGMSRAWLDGKDESLAEDGKPSSDQVLTDNDVDRIKAVGICVGKGKVPWHSADTVKLLQSFVERGKGLKDRLGRVAWADYAGSYPGDLQT